MQNLDPQAGGATILDPAFLVPFQDRLRPLYGSAPHRISHCSAMVMAPAAIKAGLALYVSGPPADPATARQLKVRLFEERDDTLLVGAAPWDGATWISRPERALLGRRQDFAIEWERLVRDGELPPASFADPFDTVDGAVKAVLHRWKQQMPPGELHRLKQEHQQLRRGGSGFDVGL